MARQSSRFLKGKKVKNPGATLIKRFIKAVNDLESVDGDLNAELRINSSSDFTVLKTIANKFPDAANYAHLQTLIALAPEIEEALTDAMNAKVWDWQYGDGDIVQTGQLRDSVTVLATEQSLLVSYSAMSRGDGADYAAIVYYGGYIHPYGNPSVQIYMPGRPWIKDVLVSGQRVPKFPLTTRYLYHYEKFILQKIPDLFK